MAEAAAREDLKGTTYELFILAIRSEPPCG